MNQSTSELKSQIENLEFEKVRGEARISNLKKLVREAEMRCEAKRGMGDAHKMLKTQLVNRINAQKVSELEHMLDKTNEAIDLLQKESEMLTYEIQAINKSEQDIQQYHENLKSLKNNNMSEQAVAY